MNMLSDNIEQMREYGIGLGLDDKDIDACIRKSLESSANDENKHTEEHDSESSESSPRRKPKSVTCHTLVSWSCSLLKISVVACFLSWCFYVATWFHEPSRLLFSSVTQTYGYNAMRVVRLASLPLWNLLDLSEFRGDSCIIHNPYFLPEDLDCGVCLNVTDVVDITDSLVTGDSHDRYRVNSTIARMMDDADTQATFHDLKSAYLRNTYKLQKRDLVVKTNLKGVKSLSELMTTKSESRLMFNMFTHVEWHPTRIGPAQVLREVFKRPSFIPLTSEILVERLVYIDGHRAKPYTIELFGSRNMWYVQGQGQRELVFIPLGRCGLECRSVQVTVSAGHTLYYPAGVWRVDSLPAPLGSSSDDDLSVSFIGSFI